MIDEKKQILAQDLEEGKTIKEILFLSYPSTLFIYPGMTAQPKDYQGATVVIALSNSDQARRLTAEKDLPEHTPILFLGTEDRLPSVCGGNATARLVDYLKVPISKDIFLHKISLLSQVQRITTKISKQITPLNDDDSLTGLYNSCAHKNVEDNLPQLSPLAFLKDKLDHIRKQARSSALSSLERLAENVAGPEHKAQIASVSHYISLLGSHIGIPAKHLQTCHNSITLYNCFRALLHNDLLAKPDKLTWDERKTIEDLPSKLTELADMLDYFTDERQLLLSFDERYNGTGFPDGLKGDEIPLGARLFHIVDALAAMNADRPFRKKLLPKEIIKELKQGAGSQFDPFLVFQLLTVIDQIGLTDIEPGFLIQTRQDIMNSFTQHRP